MPREAAKVAGAPKPSAATALPLPCVLASMISLMRPAPTLFLAASFTLYHVPHLRLSSLKERSLELMNTSFHSSLLSTEYCSTKPAERSRAITARGTSSSGRGQGRWQTAWQWGGQGKPWGGELKRAMHMQWLLRFRAAPSQPWHLLLPVQKGRAANAPVHHHWGLHMAWDVLRARCLYLTTPLGPSLYPGVTQSWPPAPDPAGLGSTHPEASHQPLILLPGPACLVPSPALCSYLPSHQGPESAGRD